MVFGFFCWLILRLVLSFFVVVLFICSNEFFVCCLGDAMFYFFGFLYLGY